MVEPRLTYLTTASLRTPACRKQVLHSISSLERISNCYISLIEPRTIHRYGPAHRIHLAHAPLAWDQRESSPENDGKRMIPRESWHNHRASLYCETYPRETCQRQTDETVATFSIECVGFSRDLSETFSTSERPSLASLNRMCSQQTRDGTFGRHSIGSLHIRYRMCSLHRRHGR